MAFLTALYGAGAAAFGARRQRPELVESARRAMLLSWPLISVGALAIIVLLVSGRYDVEYVAKVTSSTMPPYLKVTALWGGQAGSLVFWSWLMAAFASAAGLRRWDRDRDLLPWVIVVTMITLAFFLSLVIFVENPFRRLWLDPVGNTVTAFLRPAGARPLVPSDGQGLNPLLRHPGMIIHPPMLYLGFVSFVIPYAFAIAALVARRTDDRWIRVTRRWTLVAWLFLALGLLLGGRWAYDVLGWGGYWGWDPVEIAAFMPFLSGTAFLHSVMVQEKKGMLKHWNVLLIILTYVLVIFGTFLTRSGVLSSVHAFAQSAIGPMFFAFIGITSIVSVRLLLDRWGDLRGENQLNSLISRESLFLLNNFLFVIILAVCFLGVIFPLASELFTGQTVTVGPEWYERITGPLFAGLLLLMGVAPLSAYGSSSWRLLGRQLWVPGALSLVVPAGLLLSGIRNWAAVLGYSLASLVALVTLYEFWRGTLARHRRHGESVPLALVRLAGRNRRRYGGYIIHLGVVLMALGIIGIELFQTETQGTLARGEQLSLGQHVLVFEGLTQFTTPDGREVSRAEVSVYKEGRFVGQLFPRQDFYVAANQPMTIPGVRSTLEEDLYLLLVGWEPIAQQGATFKVFHNPLVNFVWLGGVVFILGTLVAAWPDRETAPVRRRVPAGAWVSGD
ncbi:MAG TPA: cytochrome c-type biogenesis CcmF C-terminal domain-containing protein [Anaerolineales bacterium]|nr:cytochrome c-type biogenesis CcmF C-terminal domain-containing protein [Anaerolineales bacterium]